MKQWYALYVFLYSCEHFYMTWHNVWHNPNKDLIHWGRVTHICASKLSILGSDNGLSPGRRQAIIWTKDGLLLIGPLGTNFNEILIKIHIFSFKKMRLKRSSGKSRPFCLGLYELKQGQSHITWHNASHNPHKDLHHGKIFHYLALCTK